MALEADRDFRVLRCPLLQMVTNHWMFVAINLYPLLVHVLMFVVMDGSRSPCSVTGSSLVCLLSPGSCYGCLFVAIMPLDVHVLPACSCSHIILGCLLLLIFIVDRYPPIAHVLMWLVDCLTCASLIIIPILPFCPC